MFNQALSFRKLVWYRLVLDQVGSNTREPHARCFCAEVCFDLISDPINVIESSWQYPSPSRFACSCSWFVCETQGAGHGWLQRHIGLSRLNSRRGEEDTFFFVQECESFHSFGTSSYDSPFAGNLPQTPNEPPFYLPALNRCKTKIKPTYTNLAIYRNI